MEEFCREMVRDGLWLSFFLALSDLVKPGRARAMH